MYPLVKAGHHAKKKENFWTNAIIMLGRTKFNGPSIFWEFRSLIRNCWQQGTHFSYSALRGQKTETIFHSAF